MPLSTFRYRAEIYEKAKLLYTVIFTGMCTFLQICLMLCIEKEYHTKMEFSIPSQIFFNVIIALQKCTHFHIFTKKGDLSENLILKSLPSA